MHAHLLLNAFQSEQLRDDACLRVRLAWCCCCSSGCRYEKVLATLDDDGHSLDERMMPFQREGVQFGLRQAGRVLIGAWD